MRLLSKRIPKLFSDSPGEYNKGTMKIHLKDGTRPIALKCRHVAYACKEKVEAELDRLLGLGHLIEV